MYCVKMKRSEQEFFSSGIGKVLALIDMWQQEKQRIANAVNGDGAVRKFSDIKGLI